MLPSPIPPRRSVSPLPRSQQQPPGEIEGQYIYATPKHPTVSTTTSSFQATTTTMSAMEGVTSTSSPNANATGNGGMPLYLCQPFVRAALVTGKFKSIVVLPKYVDVNEWVAVNSTSPPPT